MRKKKRLSGIFLLIALSVMAESPLASQRPLDCCKTCGTRGQSQWGTRFSYQCQVGQNNTPCIWRMCDTCIVRLVEVEPGIIEPVSCCPELAGYCSSCTGMYVNDPFIDSCYGLPLCPCNNALGGA